MIPQEVLFRAKVLGYLPEEYIGHALKAIEASSEEGPEKMLCTIDKLLPLIKSSPEKVHKVLHRIWLQNAKKNNGVVKALVNMKSFYKWAQENNDFLVQYHLNSP